MKAWTSATPAAYLGVTPAEAAPMSTNVGPVALGVCGGKLRGVSLDGPTVGAEKWARCLKMGRSPKTPAGDGAAELRLGRESLQSALFDATEPDFVGPGGSVSRFVPKTEWRIADLKRILCPPGDPPSLCFSPPSSTSCGVAPSAHPNAACYHVRGVGPSRSQSKGAGGTRRWPSSTSSGRRSSSCWRPSPRG